MPVAINDRGMVVGIYEKHHPVRLLRRRPLGRRRGRSTTARNRAARIDGKILPVLLQPPPITGSRMRNHC